jgi:lysyl-tRNA synthetase class 2
MESANFDILRQRAKLLQSIRSFFLQQGYLEVDTALLCPALIPESSLEVFQSRYQPHQGPAQELYLIPSPELWMKRLIAVGSGSIFQICKSFRNSEPLTSVHQPEFTMLEWYSVGSDYRHSIDIMEDLFTALVTELSLNPIVKTDNSLLDCTRPFQRLAVADAFRQYLQLDLQQLVEDGLPAFAEAALSLDLSVTAEDRPEDLFHKIFLAGVEPRLPNSRAIILYDYPALIPTLARRKTGTPWAERWELYLAGVEIANCYSEETDPAEYERYYRDQDRQKQQARIAHPTDWELVRYIREYGFPQCSGVALGLERLFMFLLNLDSIRDLGPFGGFSPSNEAGQ